MRSEVECALARVWQRGIEIYVDKDFRPIRSVFTLLASPLGLQRMERSPSGRCTINQSTVTKSSHLHMVIHACLTAYTPLCANQMPVLLFRCSIRCAI
jgi:hypothetical protein